MLRVTYTLEVTLEPIMKGESPKLPDHDFDNPNLPYSSYPHLENAMGIGLAASLAGPNGQWCVSGARFNQRVIENVADSE